MKIAELHDGKTIVFPPDMEDHAIDTMVKAHLGIDANAPLLQAISIGIESINAFAQGVIQGQQILSTELAQLKDSLAQLQQSTVSNGEITKTASLLVYAGLERVATVLGAPKTIVTDKDGKPIGMEVK